MVFGEDVHCDFLFDLHQGYIQNLEETESKMANCPSGALEVQKELRRAQLVKFISIICYLFASIDFLGLLFIHHLSFLYRFPKVFEEKVCEQARHMAWVSAVVYFDERQRDVCWLMNTMLRTFERSAAATGKGSVCVNEF